MMLVTRGAHECADLTLARLRRLTAGYLPDETTSRAIPIYRTATYRMKDTDTAAKLFALQELGNIYSTSHRLGPRFANCKEVVVALTLATLATLTDEFVVRRPRHIAK